MPADVREQFWRQVVECETGKFTTDFQRLTESGVHLPEPTAIRDEQIGAKLSEIFTALAQLRVFVRETDHLSDRDLYSVLWHRVLREEISRDDAGGCWHVHLLMTGSEEDNYLYLKYYADERFRRDWHSQFPDYQMPAHEEPPYDRDATLPKPPYPM